MSRSDSEKTDVEVDNSTGKATKNLNEIKDLSIKLLTAISKNNIEDASNLITLGANVNFTCVKDYEENTLYYFSNIEETTRFLSKLYGSTYYIPYKSTTNSALHLAIKTKSVAMASLLISKGANVNCKNEFGGTPLIEAICVGSVELVELLLNNKADPNIQGRDGLPLKLAMEGKFPKITKLLLDAGADLNLDFILYCAVTSKFTEGLKLLLDTGVEIPSENKIEALGMTVGGFYNNPEAAKLLIAAGADVNGILNKNKQTPFLLAVGIGKDVHIDIVKLMLKNGADVNAQNSDGNTPLHNIIENGNIELIKLMLENGANINVVNSKGETPFKMFSLLTEKTKETLDIQAAFKSALYADEAVKYFLAQIEEAPDDALYTIDFAEMIEQRLNALLKQSKIFSPEFKNQIFTSDSTLSNEELVKAYIAKLDLPVKIKEVIQNSAFVSQLVETVFSDSTNISITTGPAVDALGDTPAHSGAGCDDSAPDYADASSNVSCSNKLVENLGAATDHMDFS